MKILIASDIHGSAYYCRMLDSAFTASGADKMLLLGDILYHGPRNDLPREYAPREVSAILNRISGKTLCVRGNCEAEVDGMVLDFPVLAEYALILDGDREFFAHHGHHTGIVPKRKGLTVLSGHTHIPDATERDDVNFLNPGSVSIPKENSPHSYMLYSDGLFEWVNLESGKVYKTFKY